VPEDSHFWPMRLTYCEASAGSNEYDFCAGPIQRPFRERVCAYARMAILGAMLIRV
jgi:hypothetical protein